MVNKELIENWGIPDSLKDREVKFIFNNKDIPNENTTLFEILNVNGTGSKFCICDLKNNKPIFIMHFVIYGISKIKVIQRAPEIKIELICLLDKNLRNKGIATYYLNKLIDFANENNIRELSLCPNPNDESFNEINKDDILSKKDLIDFYIKIFMEKGFKYKKDNIKGYVFRK